jgi:uncharacterized protein (TIGR02118 family)
VDPADRDDDLHSKNRPSACIALLVIFSSFHVFSAQLGRVLIKAIGESASISAVRRFAHSSRTVPEVREVASRTSTQKAEGLIRARIGVPIPLPNREEIMVKISVLYPHQDTFNMDYYLNNHIPMLRQKLGAACKGVAVEQGLSGGPPGSRPTYVAMGHLLFESVESFRAAFVPHGPTIQADIRNFSAVRPVVQISEIVITR